MYRDMLPNHVCKHLGEVHPLTLIDSFIHGGKNKTTHTALSCF